jgi:hypothetical protein
MHRKQVGIWRVVESVVHQSFFLQSVDFVSCRSGRSLSIFCSVSAQDKDLTLATRSIIKVDIYLSNSSSECANVQLMVRGQTPLVTRSRHMLTLYLEPALIPIGPSPALRAMPPCCARNRTKPAATVRAASRALAISDQVGIPTVSRNQKSIV